MASSSAHVVLPAETLARSPSRADGVSEADEQRHRFWGCELIEEAGVLLRLPQVVMVTAQTMLHRFYYRKSLRDFDAFRVAIGCLFLAAKVEERPKRIKDVLSVFYAIYRRRKWRKTKLAHQLLELESESYFLWRDWLVMVERQILIDVGFSLYTIMEHPHKYILYYIKILDGSKAFAQKAWGFLNDSLRVDLCVRFRAEVIACAAIFVAARQLQIKLPDAPAWYELFNVDRASLAAVANEIVQLYKREKIVWLDALTSVDPFAVDDLPDLESATISSDQDKPELSASTPLVAETEEKDHSRTDLAMDPAASAEPTPTAVASTEVQKSNELADVTREKRKSRFHDEEASSPHERPASSSSRRQDRERSSDRDRDRGRDRERDRDRRDRRDRRRSRSRSRSDDRDGKRHERSRHRRRSRSHERTRARRSRSRSRRR